MSTLLFQSIESIAQQDGPAFLRLLAEVEILAQLKLLVKLSFLLRRKGIDRGVLEVINDLASELMSQLEAVICI